MTRQVFTYKNFILLSLVMLTFICSSRQEYNKDISMEMISGSMAAYCGEKKLEGLGCGPVCQNLKGYEFVYQHQYNISYKHSVSFSSFVNVEQGRFMVAFRGTNTIAQLLYELALSSGKPCPILKNSNGTVGSYFCHYYNKYIQDDFIELLEKMSYDFPGFDFFITGHSLGGAFATLAALDLSGRHFISQDKIQLYTYGSPRVGDGDFVNEVLANIKEVYRVTHNKDLVPHVPPNCYADGKQECVGGGYLEKVLKLTIPKFDSWHLTPEIFYPENSMEYKTCDEIEDDNCSNQFEYHMFNIADHRKYLGIGPAC